MELCLRIDLDYVPWDTPDVEEFGHGEPAMTLRLLEFAKYNGFKFHFFISNRVLRAFPSVAEAVLNEGHDLDWLCKHPNEEARLHVARQLFNILGHSIQGLAYKEEWNTDKPVEMSFVSSKAKRSESWHFQDKMPSMREISRYSGAFREWLESCEDLLVIRPQYLAVLDPKLTKLGPFLTERVHIKTLRDRLT